MSQKNVVNTEVLPLQTSELWRRGVVRPRTHDAVRDIRGGTADENTPVDYLLIDDSLFSCLIYSRLFDDLNAACGTLIDDYEEDQLAGDALATGITIIDRHAAEAESPSRLRDFLGRLATLANIARDTETPIIFIL